MEKFIEDEKLPVIGYPHSKFLDILFTNTTNLMIEFILPLPFVVVISVLIMFLFSFQFLN